MFFLFAVAGNETLRNGIPGGLWTLLGHPDQLAKLLADPSLLPGAIEEMLRFMPPVVHFRRTATRDVELGGRAVQAGDKVVVFHVGANRDPAVFADPDRFDIERSPNDHVTFGAGPHFCLGAHLARRQMTAMFTESLWRLPGLRPRPRPAVRAAAVQLPARLQAPASAVGRAPAGRRCSAGLRCRPGDRRMSSLR